MNNELEKIWNDGAVAIFKVLSPQLSVGTEETHENPQDSRDFNPGPPDYEAGLLITRP
jgi:hypothetical protein